jgi:hypothetical protein
MFTGKLPFPSDTAQESMIMRLTDEPKTLREMNPQVVWPAAIESVMRHALQRKSSERYQSANDFGNALMAAVESMPKQQQADMTMVVGAADGTVVLQAPPVTRADPDAPPVTRQSAAPPVIPAPAPVVAPPKSKMPLIAGGAAVTVAAAAAVFFMMSQGKAAAKPDITSSAPPPIASAPVNPQSNGATSPPASSPGPVSQGTQSPAAQLPAETFAKTAPTNKATVSGAPVATAAVDISARLPALLDQSTEDATAARALREAEQLQPKAIASSDKIGLSLVRANAFAMLGKDRQSCEIIEMIKERGAATVYAEKIAIMVRNCAQ